MTKLAVTFALIASSLFFPAQSIGAAQPIPLITPYPGGINPNYVVGDLLGMRNGVEVCGTTSLSLALRDRMTIIPASLCVNGVYG